MAYKEKSFSGFSVGLATGSKRKQRLSNHLRIEIEDDRVATSQKLTLREARALQKWLNDNLPVSTSSTSTGSTTSESA
jgi:hypothetical protein